MSINIQGLQFEEIESNELFDVHYNKELKLALCKARREYIPIANFKEMFFAIDLLFETQEIKHLLFDKRNLRTFHQPSMEWYFAIWKRSALKKGLKNHYKILPPLPWFEKAVQAGKEEIYKKYGRDILKDIDVKYFSTEIEVVNEILLQGNIE